MGTVGVYSVGVCREPEIRIRTHAAMMISYGCHAVGPLSWKKSQQKSVQKYETGCMSRKNSWLSADLCCYANLEAGPGAHYVHAYIYYMNIYVYASTQTIRALLMSALGAYELQVGPSSHKSC